MPGSRQRHRRPGARSSGQDRDIQSLVRSDDPEQALKPNRWWYPGSPTRAAPRQVARNRRRVSATRAVPIPWRCRAGKTGRGPIRLQAYLAGPDRNADRPQCRAARSGCSPRALGTQATRCPSRNFRAASHDDRSEQPHRPAFHARRYVLRDRSSPPAPAGKATRAHILIPVRPWISSCMTEMALSAVNVGVCRRILLREITLNASAALTSSHKASSIIRAAKCWSLAFSGSGTAA